MTELFKSIKSPCRVKRPTEKNTMRNAILNLQVSPGSWLSGIPLAVWNLGCLESFGCLESWLSGILLDSWVSGFRCGIPGCLESLFEPPGLAWIMAAWNPWLSGIPI
jgi:hypothetical protein